MNKLLLISALTLAIVASIALAVDPYSVKQVRDPRVLATKLTSDFTSVVSTSDAARVTALEATAVTNASLTASAYVTNATAVIAATAWSTQLCANVDGTTNTVITPTAWSSTPTLQKQTPTITLQRN